MKKTAIDQLGFLIHDVGRLLRRNFEKRGQEHGLSSAQWRLLVRVVREQNPTQARLAELMEIEPISVSRLVDRMEQGGWVKRCAHETDRRINRVVPTDKSLAAYSTIKAVAADVFEEALTGVGEDQRQALMSALVVMVNNLSSDETATTSSNVEKQAES
ncbi:MarR family winged helix-turn-helix transcriptional regulator [Hoeflea sp. EC-HK425]|uniref:MarR family winged helix-turn-helix transcriptional regulator n=1 Tax=Hoeflea sp. EC-HK425 TaxID=2038388 RepID=UPI001252D805|nr:MarR family winged helix-turn-helix transcriptional regulator [Hoeflea sp. EC-HK425]VVT21656.1 MarR family transcriptional regulator [Hoeflea sp. EC-HK425]